MYMTTFENYMYITFTIALVLKFVLISIWSNLAAAVASASPVYKKVRKSFLTINMSLLTNVGV